MGKSLEEVMAALPAGERAAVEKRTRELIAEEMTLRGIRSRLGMTQDEMADCLEIRQEGVSRIENREDLLLSTLRSYIEALGGELQLVIRFPDHPELQLAHLGELGSQRPKVRKAARKKTR